LGSYWHVGLETNLAAALLLGAVVAAHEGRWTLAPILAALAALTRPDTALAAPMLLAVWLREREGRPTKRGWIAFAALGLLWLGFSTWYFGSPYPASLGAKNGTTPRARYLTRAGAAIGTAARSWTVAGSTTERELQRRTAANIAVFAVIGIAALAGA